MDKELIAAKFRIDIHSEYMGNVICKDGNSWAVIEPNGNVQFSLNSLQIARAWCRA